MSCRSSTCLPLVVAPCALSVHQCAMVVDILSNQTIWTEGRSGYGINHLARSCGVADLLQIDGLAPARLVERLTWLANRYRARFCGRDHPLRLIEGEFHQYQRGDQHACHFDDLGDQGRVLSCVIVLNSEFIGGTVTFPAHRLCFSPEPGAALFFPSGPSTPHLVSPITAGTRLSIAAWFR